MCLECVGCASRAGGVCCLGESVSRSGESLLPKREFEEHSDGGLSRSPSECNSPKRGFEAGFMHGARSGEVT